MWMTYSVHYSFGGNPVDPEPTKYSDIRFWSEEINALRWANAHGQRAIEVAPGKELR